MIASKAAGWLVSWRVWLVAAHQVVMLIVLVHGMCFAFGGLFFLVCGGWSRVWWWVCLLLLLGGCVVRVVCVWRRFAWCVVSRLLDCLVPLVLSGAFVPEGCLRFSNPRPVHRLSRVRPVFVVASARAPLQRCLPPFLLASTPSAAVKDSRSSNSSGCHQLSGCTRVGHARQ